MISEATFRDTLAELAGDPPAPGLAERVRTGARRRRRRQALASVAGAGAVVATAGLAVSLLPAVGTRTTPAATTTSGPTVIDPRCAAIAEGSPPNEPSEPLPATGTLVEAMWCTRSTEPAGPRGLGSIVEARSEAGLDRLAAFLRQPDRLPQEASVVCTARVESPPTFGWLWVRTADGVWHRPRWPRRFCGFRPGAVELLRDLPFRTVTLTPVTRAEELPRATDPVQFMHRRP